MECHGTSMLDTVGYCWIVHMLRCLSFVIRCFRDEAEMEEQIRASLQGTQGFKGLMRYDVIGASENQLQYVEDMWNSLFVSICFQFFRVLRAWTRHTAACCCQERNIWGLTGWSCMMTAGTSTELGRRPPDLILITSINILAFWAKVLFQPQDRREPFWRPTPHHVS